MDGQHRADSFDFLEIEVAYRETGLTFSLDVYFEKDTRRADPLVALALYRNVVAENEIVLRLEQDVSLVGLISYRLGLPPDYVEGFFHGLENNQKEREMLLPAYEYGYWDGVYVRESGMFER